MHIVLFAFEEMGRYKTSVLGRVTELRLTICEKLQSPPTGRPFQ